MASQTVDSLLLQTQVDDSGLTQQFNKQIQEVNRLTDSVNRASAAMRPITITADTKALSAAEQSVSEFFASFQGAQVGEVVGLLEAMNAELVATGQTDFTGKLIAQLTAIQSEFAATSTEAKELQAIIATLSQSTLPVAAAGGGGGPPPPPPVDQFSAFRREAAATNATVAELTATMARGSAGALAYGEGMARTAVQQRALATETEQTARRTAQFSEASRQASLGPFARGLEEIRLTGIGTRAELERGTVAFQGHGQGARQAATAIAALAATSVGAEGPVAKLAQSALLLSGGLGAVAGAAVFVLALAKTVEFLTTAEREAADAQDKLVQGLLTEAESAIPRAVRAHEALTAALEAQAKARGLLASLDRGATVVTDVVELVGSPLSGALAARVELSRRAAKQEQDDIRAVAQARADVGRVEIESITAVLQAGIATDAQRARGVQLLKELQSQVHALIVPEERRLEIAKQITGLQQGQNLGVSARLAAETQAIQSENTLRQQAIQADEQNLRAQFAQEAIIRETSLAGELAAREQFFTARRQLIVNAARADESAIRQRIGVAEQRPVTDVASQTTRDAEVAGLRAQLQLREQIKQAQLDQLANEKRLAELTPLERVGTLAPLQRLTPGEDFKLQLKPQIDATELRAELEIEIAAAIQGASDDAKQISFERAVESANKAAVAADRLDSAIHRIAGAAGGLASTVAGLLGIGAAADAAIGQVVGLVGALGDVNRANADIQAARAAFQVAQATGDVAGQAAAQGAGAAASAEKVASVIGVVTAGLGIVGNLLSIGSALDAEHNRLVADNSLRLAELSLRLDQSFQGSAGVQKAAGLTGEVASVVSQVTNAEALGFLKTQDAFEAAVRATGLTIQEFDKLIKDTTGIEILDSKGKVVAATLAIANDAFQKVIQSITQLSTDPAALRAQAQTLDSLGLGGRAPDANVAALQRERDVQLQALNLNPQEEARIRALNLETAKGRAEFLRFEQDLARRAQEKGLSAAELGSFKNVDELFQALGIGAEAVNAFTDSIHAVTDQTANIPRSFKQFAAASAAEIAGFGPNVPRQPETPRLRGTDINIPLPPELRGTDGASLPAFTAALRESTLSLKAVKERPAQITGNTVNQTFPTNVGDIREFARLVAIAMRQLGTADFSSGSGPLDLG